MDAHLRPAPTPRRRRRALWAVLLVGILTAGTQGLGGTSAGAEPAGGTRAPAVQRTDSLAGRARAAEGPPAESAAVAAARRRLPAPVWPGAATASVVLPADTASARAARVRAGALPVTLGAATAGSRAKVSEARTVQVSVLDRAAATALGVDGLVLTVARTDGSTTAASVTLDYGRYASAYGGDWAARLRLARLPACALTTPTEPRCRSLTPLPSRNDTRARTVTGDVDVAQAGAAAAPSGTVLALAAGSKSGAGDYTATSLSPSAQWGVTPQTGAFTWTYDLPVPPGVNGPTPDLSIDYSSGSVDGRIASTNNQPSWIGDGHELGTGYIERSYVTCADDMTGGNNTEKTGDLCWKSDNATMSFGGHAGQLVRDTTTGLWRLRNDDGSRIERLTGGTNGDNDQEHWRLTDTDGTRYYFGLGKRYAADTGNTNATWTVPVYGNHSGEPCRAATFAASSCQQAWRWNLDYVVDVHGNTTTYTYAAETNNYGRNKNTAVSTYTRGGYLTQIEYGEQTGSEHTTTAPDRVTFTTAERCLPSGSITCDPAQLTASTATSWPDVPFDRICTSGTSCPTQQSPTFFTRRRLTGLTTQVWGGAAYRDVDTWQFRQSFLDPGDGTSPALWLEGITHSGKNGTPVVLPEVSFTPVGMDNRVDIQGDIAPPLRRHRVAGVRTESGAQISVNYTAKECAVGSTMPTAPESNIRRCFPVYWAAEGQDTPTLNYFHKYLVASVIDDDLVGGAPDRETYYDYLGAPAWHYTDDTVTPTKYRSWSDWRGYGTVRVRTGSPQQPPQGLTQSLYLRGMNGDRLPGGGTRTVTVTDSQGGQITDSERANGFLREEITYNGVGGAETTGTINDPWIGAATASDGTISASLLRPARTRTRTPLAAGGTRTAEAATTYDTYGLPTAVDDRGDTATAADDRCTRTTYARNTTSWILEPEATTETVKVGCAAPTTRPADVVADRRQYYDGSTTLGAAPSRGDLTRTDALTPTSGAPAYQTTARTTYDAAGRVTESYDGLDRKTTTAYTPAAGGPVTQVVTSNPLGHVTTTTVDPARGSATREVDRNGKRTDLAYDAIGRLTGVWLPGRDKTAGATPTTQFGYLIRRDGPTSVSTGTLRNDGTYTTRYALFDGLLRARQTQAPASGGGRLIAETTYDSQGRPVDQSGPYYNTTAPTSSLYEVPEADLPAQTRTTYDGAGRVTASIVRSKAVERWRTTTTYAGERVTLDPPDGATPTTTVTDARGRKTALWQYKASSPTGAHDDTTYTYTAGDRLASVTDPAGNTWTHTWDLRGRETRSTHPDHGAVTAAYDNAGQATTVTDARGTPLHVTYDELGRRTSLREGSPTGPQLATWLYDTLAKGYQTSATRWVGTAAYVDAVTGYDDRYRPTGTAITIPAAEDTLAGVTGKLAGTYTTTLTYNLDGGLKTQKLAAAPGLPAETLTTFYDTLGKPTRFGGNGAYVNGTTYSPYGEPLQVALGQSIGKFAWQSFEYEDGTRRLTRSTLDREGIADHTADLRYTYDPGGNLTRISDTAPGQTDTECFRYDPLRRLTEAWTPTDQCAAAPSTALLGGPAPYWQTFTYDAVGNRLTRTSHAAAGDTVRTSTYPTPGGTRPHAATTVTTTGPAGTATDAFGYDQVSNTTSRTRAGTPETLTWNSEGRLAKITNGSGTTENLYDAAGGRLVRRDPQSVTVYLGGTEIRLDRATATLTSTRYYTHLGQPVAVRTTTDGVKLLAVDHHGTSQIAVDATTQAVTRRRADPFGDSRDRSPVVWPGQRSFLDGTKDPSTGLVHLGIRDYDPIDGRFLSVDPVADSDSPQQLNAYSYAHNNPATLSDPDGQIAIGDDGHLYHPQSGKCLNCVNTGVNERAFWRKRMDQFNADHDKAAELVKEYVKKLHPMWKVKLNFYIPNASRKRNGERGFADVVAYDEINKTYYVWEVKYGSDDPALWPYPQDTEKGGIRQLDNYIEHLRRQEPGTTVEKGFYIPAQFTQAPSDPNKVLVAQSSRAFSGKRNERYDGIVVYFRRGPDEFKNKEDGATSTPQERSVGERFHDWVGKNNPWNLDRPGVPGAPVPVRPPVPVPIVP